MPRPKRLRDLLWIAVPTALFLLLASLEVIGPQPIGMADNNDFAKIFGTLGIWAAPDFVRDHHLYLVTDYRVDAARFWDAGMPSSEYWIALAAKQIGGWLLPPGHFDIRVLGILHALLAALAIGLTLSALRHWTWPVRALFTAVFLLIFSDAEYVLFFNTAYMDAGTLVFLMLVFAVAWNIALDPNKTRWPWALSFCFFGALFLGAKLQHQLCLFPLIFFCLLTGLRTHSPADRAAWLTAPLALVATSGFMVVQTPVDYLADSRFSVVFTKLVPLSQPPEPVLRELRRPSSDLRYTHWNAYSPGSPLANPDYRAGFIQAVTTQKLANFYLHHPALAFQILHADFLAFSAEIPITNFGTMRREDVPQPVFHARGITLWSSLRSRFCWQWTGHVPLLYLLITLSTLLLRRTPGMVALVLTFVAIGLLCFTLGSLYDATETSRHILVFQEATDMLFIVAFYLLFDLSLQLAESRIFKQVFQPLPPLRFRIARHLPFQR